MTMRLFIFGAGYSARAFARRVADKAASIGGTTRSAANFTGLEAAGITPFLFNGSDGISDKIAEALATTTHLVVSAGPDDNGDPLLRAVGPALRAVMPALAWIGYLSTVGVYGDHDGAWVDETTPCRPVSKRSRERLAAEDAWRTGAQEAGLPLASLRLSGIYGPGRNAFVNLESGKAKRIVKPGQIFNRIHVDDIAGALSHLAEGRVDGIFNVTDDEPAPPQDVVAFAAGLMGIEPPPEIPFDAAEMSPMALSFYGETKRVSNARLKSAGYRLLHPDYREALTAMWRQGNWREET